MILRKAGKCNPTHQNKSNLDCQPDILFPTERTKRTREQTKTISDRTDGQTDRQNKRTTRQIDRQMGEQKKKHAFLR